MTCSQQKQKNPENERAKQHTNTQILELAEAGYKVASILTVKDVKEIRW